MSHFSLLSVFSSAPFPTLFLSLTSSVHFSCVHSSSVFSFSSFTILSPVTSSPYTTHLGGGGWVRCINFWRILYRARQQLRLLCWCSSSLSNRTCAGAVHYEITCQQISWASFLTARSQECINVKKKESAHRWRWGQPYPPAALFISSAVSSHYPRICLSGLRKNTREMSVRMTGLQNEIWV
jgi:hypothetical protein